MPLIHKSTYQVLLHKVSIKLLNCNISQTVPPPQDLPFLVTYICRYVILLAVNSNIMFYYIFLHAPLTSNTLLNNTPNCLLLDKYSNVFTEI